MGTESQIPQFAKEYLNNTVKVGRTMDTISNVMQQCVGIVGNLDNGHQHYTQFHPYFYKT